FRVPPELAGMRLDLFLHGELKRSSRTRAQFIIRNSAFDERGQRMKPSDRLKAEQHVFLWRPPWDETAVPTDLPTIYEDDDLLVVDKPALLPVHPTARYHKNTVIVILKSMRPNEWLSLGHRLDRETSGLLMITKNPECDRRLKKMLEARGQIEKTYLALTHGAPWPKGHRFRCDKSLAFDTDSKLGVKVKVSDAPDAWVSGTIFEVQDVTAEREGQARYSKVLCTLETGRQHQIRVHLASYEAPIVGDKLYGADDMLFARGADGELTVEDELLLELPRHALHAHKLELPHPMTGKPLTLIAPMPADLAEFWAKKAD
ncbi:MAG: RluA family pseudouridine synthase, partial [Polyangiaceae bacterium]